MKRVTKKWVDFGMLDTVGLAVLILFVGLTLVLTLSIVAGLGLDKLLGGDDPKRHLEEQQ